MRWEIDSAAKCKLAVAFLAHGFDEEFVVQFYCEQKRKGYEVLLVGNVAGRIFGRNGLDFPIDATLSEFFDNYPQHPLVICIPGDTTCSHALVTDPRIVRLIREEENRPIRTPNAVIHILKEMGIFETRQTTRN